MGFSSRLAKSLLSVILSECLVLNAAVTPTPSVSVPNRSFSRNETPARSVTRTLLTSVPRAQDAVSATLPITVAAGPHGHALRLVKASDTSGPMTSAGQPKASPASIRPLFAAKLDPSVAKHVSAATTFVENKGQWDARVKFQFNSAGKTLWLTDTGIVFDNLRAKADETSGPTRDHAAPRVPPSAPNQTADRTYDRLVFCEDFIGANGTPAVVPVDVQPGEYNYMGGSDPKGWHTGVRGYAGVIYRNVWNGIDVKLTRNGADIEQEFVVHPGADLNRVQVAYRGIGGLNIAEDGSLDINTAFGRLRETPPSIYQEIGGHRVPVEGRFKLSGSTAYTFEVAAHKAEYAVIVDPTLLYSTFLGGSAGNDVYSHNNEVANGIAVDGFGNAYVAGNTASTDFPITTGSFQVSPPSGTFITKLNATGSGLLYSTYLGSSAYISAIAVDSSGNAYVTGYNSDAYYGRRFPTTPNAYWPPDSQHSCAPFDFYVSELNSAGNQLLYSTCFDIDGNTGAGISYGVFPRAVAADSHGRVFIAGGASGYIPTTSNAYQPSYPGARQSGFVTVFDTTTSGLSSLVYSSYLGVPTAVDNFGVLAYSIAVDSFGKAYVAGTMNDAGFPVTPGAFQTTYPPCIPNGSLCTKSIAGFIAKLDPSASGSQSLIYSTYFGGMGQTSISAITVDASGNAYFTGDTSGGYYGTFPVTPGAFQTTNGSLTAAFVTKLSAGGSQLLYSTLLDGTNGYNSYGTGIATDFLGNAYVTGATNSASFPVTADAFQSTYVKQGGSTDYSSAFLTKFNSTGSALIYSSYFGGSEDDVANGIAIDQTGDAYIAGHTSSFDLPVTFGAFQQAMNGSGDAFVTKFPLGGQFRALQVTPNVGGNTGQISIIIYGTGLRPGLMVKLRGGGPDIAGTGVKIGPSGKSAIASFDLTGAAPGARDVVVTSPDGTTAVLSGAFQVWPGGAPHVWVDIVSYPSFLVGAEQKVRFVYGNDGNVDAFGVPITISAPITASINLKFQLTPPPSLPGVGGTQATSVGCRSSLQRTHSRLVSEEDNPSEVANCVLDIVNTTLSVLSIVPGIGCAPQLLFQTIFLPFVQQGIPGQTIGSWLWMTGALVFSVANCVGDSLIGLGQIFGALNIVYSGVQTYLDCAPVAQKLLQAKAIVSGDPNYLGGPTGVGGNGWILGSEVLQYYVSFENEPTASAPAHRVIVTNPIDPNSDLDTLQVLEINLVGFQVPLSPILPRAGLNEFVTNVDLRPTQDLLINVDAKIDPVSRLLSWIFTSLDPITMQPPTDPNVGFLPPGDEGAVEFSVQASQGVQTGTQIQDQATVIFDGNQPISTAVWLNTIDNTPPTSQVAALPPTENTASFKIQWAGTDQGSGIQDYTIYASDNGGPFTAFLVNTAATSTSFTGQAGHTYGFYSIARDLVGNVENPKTAAEATTQATQGAAPSFTLSPVSLAFSSVAVGSTSTSRTVKLTHRGPTVPLLTISSITTSGDYSQTNNCPGTINPGTSCTITVTFTPNVAGVLSGALSVYDSFGNAPQVVPMTGTGLASVSAAPSSLKLSSPVGSASNPGTVTVANNTATGLSLSYSASTTFNAAPGSSNGCARTLPANSNCTIAVTFTPEQPGTIYGSLTIAGAFPTQVVDLTGTATGGTGPALTFSPAKLVFKTPQAIGTTSTPLTVTMANKGTSAVAVSGLSASPGFTATPSGTKPCSGSLAVKANCTFQVTFTPPVTGLTDGSISVLNSGAINPLLYDVSGTGVNVVSFSPVSLIFPAQAVGTTSNPLSVTLSNNQSVSLNLASIVASGDYSAVPGGTNPCGSAVAANSSCTFVVSFGPTKTGAIKGVVTVTDDAPTSPQVFPLTGKGQ